MYLMVELAMGLLLGVVPPLQAQGNYKALQQLVEDYERLGFSTLSPEGDYVSIHSIFGHQDTLRLFQVTGNQIKQVGNVSHIRKEQWIGKHQVILETVEGVWWWNLKEDSHVFYKGIKRVTIANTLDRVWFWYDNTNEKVLECRTVHGKLLYVVKHVDRYQLASDGGLWAVVYEHASETTKIVYLDTVAPYAPRVLLNSKAAVIGMKVDEKGTGAMVTTKKSETTTVSYVSLEQQRMLQPLDTLTIMKGMGLHTTEVAAGRYLVQWRLPKSTVPKDTLVHIWYGNDTSLEEKFQPNVTESYLWSPSTREVTKVSHTVLETTVPIPQGRYLLQYNPYLLQDYTTETPKLELYQYDVLHGERIEIDIFANPIYISDKGRYLLSMQETGWILYDLQMHEQQELPVDEQAWSMPYFSDANDRVVFTGGQGMLVYDIVAQTATEVKGLKEPVTLVSATVKQLPTRKGQLIQSSVGLSQPILLKQHNALMQTTGYMLWDGEKSFSVIPPVAKQVSLVHFDATYRHFSYVLEDADQAPSLHYVSLDGTDRTIYQSNKSITYTYEIQQQVVAYQGSDSTLLHGILYQPIMKKPEQVVPMVVYVYGLQYHKVHQYLYPSYQDGEGFNIRLLLEQGYAVFLPDMNVNPSVGAGISVLYCMNNALEALHRMDGIDWQHIGLMGHSFGGYETDFIATHSDTFSAYISGAGHSDVVWAAHAFNYNFRFPDFLRLENNVYQFPGAFSKYQQLYLENSPLYSAAQVTAPMLLWTGMDDANVTPDHTMAFYNALRRNDKEVIALFYPKERHSMLNTVNKWDIMTRVWDWWGYQLKGVPCHWIQQGMKRDVPKHIPKTRTY